MFCLKQKNKIFIGLFLILGVVSSLLAYDNLVVHPLLTRESIKIYNQIAENEINTEQAQWIIDGSIAEDADPRYLNHFYDPSTGSGLNSGIFQGESAKEWAQNQNSVSGDYSENAIFYNYKNENYKRAYQGVGHILHLIQDMSVPAHTRNDEHASGDPFEEWAEQYGQIESGQSRFIPINNLDQAFDELASYSHDNFFSKDTVAISKDYKSTIKMLGDEKREYKINEIDGKQYIIAFSKNPDWIISEYQVHGDPYLFSDYWSMLSPQAVGYSAGAIDYFLREFEKIDQARGEQEIGLWDRIKKRASDATENVKYVWGDASIAGRIAIDKGYEETKELAKKGIDKIAFWREDQVEEKQNKQELVAEQEKQDQEEKNILPIKKVQAEEADNFEEKISPSENSKTEKIKNQKEAIQIKRIIDGDTFELENGDRVRYIGIDTPELNKPGSADDECLAWFARIRNMQLLESGPVSLVKDSSVDKDKYGRLLRYIYVGDVFINQVLVKEGLAETFFCQSGWRNCPVTSDDARKQIILDSSQEAQDHKRGIYSGVCEKEEKDGEVLGQKIYFKEDESGEERLDNKEDNENNDNDWFFIFGGSGENLEAVNSQTEENNSSVSSEAQASLDTAIISAPDFISSSTQAYFSFVANEEGANFSYKINNGEWTDCGEDLILENLEEGVQNIQVRADKQEEHDQTPAEYDWIIDLSPPDSEVINLSSYYVGSGFTVYWQGSDNQSETDYLTFDIRYKINEQDWQSWLTKTASTSSSFEADLSLDDVVCFQSRAIDYVGNVEEFGDEEFCTQIKSNPQINNLTLFDLISSSTEYTSSTTVGLDYKVINPDLVDAYLASSSPSLPEADDLNWAEELGETYQFSPGDGQRYVYIFLKDINGIIFQAASSSIIMNALPPKNPLITNIEPQPEVECSWADSDIYWINKNEFLLIGSKEEDVVEIIIEGQPYKVAEGETAWQINHNFNFDIKELTVSQYGQNNKINLASWMILDPLNKKVSFQARDKQGNLSEGVNLLFAIDINKPEWEVFKIFKSVPSKNIFLYLWAHWPIRDSKNKEYIVEYKNIENNWAQLGIEEFILGDVTHRASLPKEGEYFLRAKAIDWAGNESEWSEELNFATVYQPVISEIYAGGGNDGSFWENDFIEIYNPTQSVISLDNYSIQYSAGQSNDWEVYDLSGQIAPDFFYLIKGYSSSDNGQALEAFDLEEINLNMSVSSGKIALVNNAETITGILDENVVDFVGYGEANESEGDSPAPSINNTESLERIALWDVYKDSMNSGEEYEFSGNGWDTNNNNNDFVIRDLPEPQSSNNQAEIFVY